MKDDKRNLYYLHDLNDYKVADDYADVRDWEVIDADGRTVGKVEGLLVNKEAERVVYLDASLEPSVIEEGYKILETPATEGIHGFKNKEGDDHVIIPIGVVRIDEEKKKVHTDHIDHRTFATTKRFGKGNEVDRDTELIIFTHYFPGSRIEDSHQSGNDFYNRKEFGK